MARLPRLYAPGCAHHIIQRGNNRAPCFVEPVDRQRYLAILAEAALEHRVDIHAYVLMTNHVHMLASPQTAESSGRMMQSLGRRYVRFFNDRYHRTGTLWEGRYKSTLVDTDAYFFTVATYIEMNPVRAQMVIHPSEYPWSSYAANALGEQDSLLTQHALYLNLGCDSQERQQRYRQLFLYEPQPHLVNCLRDATNKGWAFGSEAFKASLQGSANRAPESSGWGGDRKTRKGNQGH